MSRSDEFFPSAWAGLDRRQMTEEQEMFEDQAFTDKQVLNRVRTGETTQLDYVYLAARLNLQEK